MKGTFHSSSRLVFSFSHLLFLLSVQNKAMSKRKGKLVTPGEKYFNRGMLRRIAGRLGLDFVVSGVKFANRQIGKST